MGVIPNARGVLAVDELRALLGGGAQEASSTCNVGSIKVWGEPVRADGGEVRELSMSWWLSKPVQMYLHEQTNFDDRAGDQATPPPSLARHIPERRPMAPARVPNLHAGS